METKKCERCGIEKELTGFNIDNKKPYGRQNMCKACKREIKIAKIINTDKVCWSCQKTLPRTDEYFYKCRGTYDGLQAKCKVCTNELNKARNKENRKHSSKNYVGISKRPIPQLMMSNVEELRLEEGVVYEIIRKRPTIISEFKGELVGQSERFIVLKHKLGYLEAFNKVDFLTGEREYKEVI